MSEGGSWSVDGLEALVAAGRVRVTRGGGGVNVWLPRDEGELGDSVMGDAVARAEVPEGFAANVWVHGRGGAAYLLGRRLEAEVLGQWLRESLGIDGDLFLPGCELMSLWRLAGFAVELRDWLGCRVRATDVSGWLDPDTGVVVAAPAGRDGRPVFVGGVPAARYFDLPADRGSRRAVDPPVRVETSADWRWL